jgi:hypothetical protein
MLYTPAALELALRCPFLSAGGEDDKPEMAESTLVRGDSVSAMIDDDARCLRKSYLKLQVWVDE